MEMIRKSLLVIFLLSGIAAFAQEDFAGYKILYKGKEISAHQLDSLKKVIKYYKTDLISSTNEIILTELSAQTRKKIPLQTVERLNAEREAQINKAVTAKGKVITPFTANDLDNQSVSSEMLKGHIYVLNFWFVGCKPCAIEMPELNALVNKYKGMDVKFIAIALDNADDVKKFLSKTKFDYTQIPGSRSIAKDFNVSLFPTHIIVDKQNIISYYAQGYSSKTVSVLDKNIASLLKE